MAEHLGDQIDDLADSIYDANERKGFWDSPTDPMSLIPRKIALIHGEVTEALDVHRDLYDDSDEDPLSGMTEMQEQDLTEELADIIIRVLDLAGGYDLSIGDAILAKLEKNKGRPAKHNKRY